MAGIYPQHPQFFSCMSFGCLVVLPYLMLRCGQCQLGGFKLVGLLLGRLFLQMQPTWLQNKPTTMAGVVYNSIVQKIKIPLQLLRIYLRWQKIFLRLPLHLLLVYWYILVNIGILVGGLVGVSVGLRDLLLMMAVMTKTIIMNKKRRNLRWLWWWQRR